MDVGSSMSGVEWVDHVPERKRIGKWQKVCAELRTQPGHWARVGTVGSTAYATMLKQGKLGDAHPGEFEATTRHRSDGQYDIYARYVLPHETAEPMRPLKDAKVEDCSLVFSD